MLKDMVVSALDCDDSAELETSEFEFYLTGSRFFGCARPDSDWDFMVENGPDVRKFLEKVGFYVLLDEDYDRDAFTDGVWQYGNVQVQLVNGVDLKRQARDGILKYNAEYHKNADTEDRISLWSDWHSILLRK